MNNEHYNAPEDNFIVAKLAEEASELSQALLAFLTKPVSKKKEDHFDAIDSEIADVEIMISAYKRRFRATERVDIFRATKVEKYERYFKEIGIKNIGRLRKEGE